MLGDNEAEVQWDRLPDLMGELLLHGLKKD